MSGRHQLDSRAFVSVDIYIVRRILSDLRPQISLKSFVSAKTYSPLGLSCFSANIIWCHHNEFTDNINLKSLHVVGLKQNN